MEVKESRELESMNCNFCQGVKSKLLFKKEGFNIVKCASCGLVYVNPCLQETEIAAIYEKGYSDKLQATDSLLKVNLYRIRFKD